MRVIRAARGVRISWRSSDGAADQTKQQTSLGTPRRHFVTTGCLAAASWMADSEAAGVPMQSVVIEPLIKGRDGIPLLDGQGREAAVEQPEAPAAKSYSAVASIACAALCACVTVVFLVFALP